MSKDHSKISLNRLLMFYFVFLIAYCEVLEHSLRIKYQLITSLFLCLKDHDWITDQVASHLQKNPVISSFHFMYKKSSFMVLCFQCWKVFDSLKFYVPTKCPEL